MGRRALEEGAGWCIGKGRGGGLFSLREGLVGQGSESEELST